jgi:hypothetical protein
MFLEAHTGLWVNMANVTAVSFSSDAGARAKASLYEGDGAPRLVTGVDADMLREDLLAQFRRAVPAPSGYRLLRAFHVREQPGHPVDIFAAPVIAFVFETQPRGAVALSAISDSGETSDAEGAAIERPDGTVYEPNDGSEWPTREAFAAGVIERFEARAARLRESSGSK